MCYIRSAVAVGVLRSSDRVQGAGYRVQSTGCREQVIGCRQGTGCMGQGSGCRVIIGNFKRNVSRLERFFLADSKEGYTAEPKVDFGVFPG